MSYRTKWPYGALGVLQDEWPYGALGVLQDEMALRGARCPTGRNGPTGRSVSYRTKWPYGALLVLQDEWPYGVLKILGEFQLNPSALRTRTTRREIQLNPSAL